METIAIGLEAIATIGFGAMAEFQLNLLRKPSSGQELLHLARIRSRRSRIHLRLEFPLPSWIVHRRFRSFVMPPKRGRAKGEGDSFKPKNNMLPGSEDEEEALQ